MLRLCSIASFYSSFGEKTVLCKLQPYFSKRNSIAYGLKDMSAFAWRLPGGFKNLRHKDCNSRLRIQVLSVVHEPQGTISHM